MKTLLTNKDVLVTDTDEYILIKIPKQHKTLTTNQPTWESLADFSVVLLQSDFMLASEEHPMKVHKNQWLSNLLSPSDVPRGATNQGTHPRGWGAGARAVT